MAKIPCFLCSQELEQRKDKNEKPYFICDPCGIQIFVRGRQGILNLTELISTLRKHDFPFREHARVLHEIQAILTEIRGLKKELSKLDSLLGIFTDDEDKDRSRKLIKQRIENLLARLEQLANSGFTS
jgi:DNA-directed RNA polymerase subunit RPC12/RpoP